MKIKLIEQGFESYTGALGEADFVDGVSVDDLTRIQIDRIAGAIRVESLDGQSVGTVAEIITHYSDEAEVVEALPTRELLEQEEQEEQDTANDEAQFESLSKAMQSLDRQSFDELSVPESRPVESEPAESGPVEVFSTPKHTEESLALVADELGIAGLREIAENYGVKGNSIAKLIEDILTAQARE